VATQYGIWNALQQAMILVALAASARALADEWPSYGRDPGGTRYSPLAQITPENVERLHVAWTFHTGDASDRSHERNRSGFETTPSATDSQIGGSPRGALRPDPTIRAHRDIPARCACLKRRWMRA
jgi:hypothetical protein